MACQVSDNEVRMCWGRPDEVLLLSRAIRLFVFPLFKGVVCLMMDPENTLGNQMPGAGWEPSVANCYCKV